MNLDETFSFLKNVDGPIANKKVVDVFKIGTLDFKHNAPPDLRVSEEFLLAVVDRFVFHENLNHIRIHNILFGELFRIIGGNKDTPAEVAVGFMYLCLKSESLKFNGLFKALVGSIHCNTTLQFIVDTEREVPFAYLEVVKQIINYVPFFDMLMKKFDGELQIDLKTTSNEDLKAWLDKTDQDVHDYIKGVNATKDAFK